MSEVELDGVSATASVPDLFQMASFESPSKAAKVCVKKPMVTRKDFSMWPRFLKSWTFEHGEGSELRAHRCHRNGKFNWRHHSRYSGRSCHNTAVSMLELETGQCNLFQDDGWAGLDTYSVSDCCVNSQLFHLQWRVPPTRVLGENDAGHFAAKTFQGCPEIASKLRVGHRQRHTFATTCQD